MVGILGDTRRLPRAGGPGLVGERMSGFEEALARITQMLLDTPSPRDPVVQTARRYGIRGAEDRPWHRVQVFVIGPNGSARCPSCRTIVGMVAVERYHLQQCPRCAHVLWAPRRNVVA